MTTATATFVCHDNIWQNETTVYWFELRGIDRGTGIEFDGQTYGIAESGPETSVLDADGCPLTEGDGITIAVRRAAQVTDDLRQQAAGQ